jgi:Holliday junction resolvasome RuvABC endonuclease subunit
MNILVLDPANSTGYAIVKITDTNSANIINYDFIDIENKEYAGDQYIELAEQIRILINVYDIKEIAVEDYFFSGKTCNGGTLNASYRAIIHMIARIHKLPYTILNISLWKKFINGRSTPTKEQKLLWGKEESKKLMTQESLWNRWGIKFPNYSISCKTGKPIKPRSDIVDAVAMAIFFVSIYKNIRTVTCSVIPPANIDWKKTPKGVYSYEN